MGNMKGGVPEDRVSEYPFYVGNRFKFRQALSPIDKQHYDYMRGGTWGLVKNYGKVKKADLWETHNVKRTRAIVAVMLDETDKEELVDPEGTCDCIFCYIDVLGGFLDVAEILYEEVPHYFSARNLVMVGSRLALRHPEFDDFDVLNTVTTRDSVKTTYAINFQELLDKYIYNQTPTILPIEILYVFDKNRWIVYDKVQLNRVIEFVLNRSTIEQKKAQGQIKEEKKGKKEHGN